MSPKICRSCSVPKSEGDFYQKPEQPCKECWKAKVRERYRSNEEVRQAARRVSKAWRAKNLAKVRASSKASKAKRKSLIQTWIREYKGSNPCCDCRRILPYWVMQFDHRPDEEKRIAIALLVKENTTYKQVAEEVAKCDLVCVICHRHRTYCRGRDLPIEPLAQVAR